MNGKTFNDGRSIEAALRRLGRRMIYDDAEPVFLVVCGGSALNVLNVAQRPTGDVDVLAMVEAGSGGRLKLTRPKALPDSFRKTVALVADDLGFDDPEWLNFGPAPVLDWGEPEGFRERWVKKDYGPCLTVYYIGRLDQIHFKLLASLDPKNGRRHLEDLVTHLKPTADEIESAARWLLKKNRNAGFVEGLKNILGGMGYEHIGEKLSA